MDKSDFKLSQALFRSSWANRANRADIKTGCSKLHWNVILQAFSLHVSQKYLLSFWLFPAVCLCLRWIHWKGTAGLFSHGWTDRWWAVAASSSVMSHAYTADTWAFIICPQAPPCRSPLQLLTSLIRSHLPHSHLKQPPTPSNGEKSICKAQPEGTFPS